MATRDGSRFLEQALDSVWRQTYKNYEVIAVDDASSDGTRALLKSYGAKVRLLANTKNIGLAASLNRGIKSSRGEFIARLDDDDLWADRRKLKEQVLLMRRQPQVGVCGAQNIVIDAAGRELYRLKYPASDGQIRRKMLARNQLPHSSVLVRKEALAQCGLYDEAWRYAQDFELWLRIGLKWKLANLPRTYIKQRINLRGVTARKNMRQFWSFLRVAYKYRRAYPGFWASTPVYLREFILNLLPKPAFYRLAGRHRRTSRCPH